MILAACGLRREARLIEKAGMVAVAGGGDAARLERELVARLSAPLPSSRRKPAVPGAAPATQGPDVREDDENWVVLSIGLAGALSPKLRVGDVIVGTSPLPHPGEGLVEWLLAHMPDAHGGTVLGQNIPAATPAEKRHLHTTTGALAIDMESHIAARVAARHRLPFAAIRIISDDSARTLPPAALVGMNPDGSMAIGTVLASLAGNPMQLAALIRTGLDAERAFRSLRRALRALESHGIGQLDLGELCRDV